MLYIGPTHFSNFRPAINSVGLQHCSIFSRGTVRINIHTNVQSCHGPQSDRAVPARSQKELFVRDDRDVRDRADVGSHVEHKSRRDNVELRHSSGGQHPLYSVETVKKLSFS